eukprot:c21688_g1_i1 orf=393-2282(-)
MLSAPPLLPHRPQPAASSLSTSSACAAYASLAMANEEEGININTTGSNVFASLMPNVFSRLQHCDDTVSEQEFEDFHRLLNLARSEDDLIKGNLLMNQREKGEEITQEEVRKKPPPLINSDYGGGKENALPTKPPQRNKFSRRERSSRITTNRKPFVVDVRSFGSLLNNNALGKFKKPQDVHAFWEAAEEREASEAIMCKLRGRSEQKALNGNSILRRLGVRRTNSQRATTRLKRFAVELPSCAEQVLSLDQEQLEEESVTEESSFTFLSNPEFRAENHLFEQSNAERQINAPQLVSPVQAVEKAMKMVYLDGSAKLRDQAEDDHDILSDGKSPLVNSTGTGQCLFGLADNITFMDGSDECEKQSQVPDIVDITQSDQAVQPINSLAADSQDRNLSQDIDAANELELKVTPYNRNIAAKRTPFTSPTPPSNPLAAFGLRKDNVVEDMSKRRLYFDDTMDSPTLELDSPAPIMENTPLLQDSLASPEAPKTVVEEKNLEVAEEINSIMSDLQPTEAMKIPEQSVTNPPKKVTAKRRRPLQDRRNSLEGAGTNWKEGQRRSTRIRSRPLEWWRGERFLRGRVHKSLPTVIGIKYSSPPPCWPKRGTKPPTFKVESYVTEEFARYVQLAASY